jgi:hypothetical protein
MERTFELMERRDGDGWLLRLIEDGVEREGGVYPAEEYGDALDRGQTWVSLEP